MSAEEQIAVDALEQVGVVGLTVFHLRCVALYKHNLRAMAVSHRQPPWTAQEVEDCGEALLHALTRAGGLDGLHSEALYEHELLTWRRSHTALEGRPASGRFA